MLIKNISIALICVMLILTKNSYAQWIADVPLNLSNLSIQIDEIDGSKVGLLNGQYGFCSFEDLMIREGQVVPVLCSGQRYLISLPNGMTEILLEKVALPIPAQEKHEYMDWGKDW